MNAPDPATPALVTAGAIPFYRSPVYLCAMGTVLGALTTLYPKVAAAIGITTPAGATAFIELVGAGMTLAGGAVIWIIRQISTLQPITLTQKGATDAPATLARVQTSVSMAQAGITPSGVLAAQIQTSQDATAKTLKEFTHEH